MIMKLNMKKLKVGDLAPKIECKNQDGEIIKLSDFYGKKIVIGMGAGTISNWKHHASKSS